MRNEITILIILATIFAGCEMKYREVKLAQKNPTTYVFNTSIADIKAAIKIKWDRASRKNIEFASDSNIVWGSKVLRLPENINDAYIYSFEPDTSKNYISDEGIIWYYAEYHLHMVEISKNTTRVEVITIRPKIMIGKNPLRGIIKIAPATVIVPPSTIEEYQILLSIGEALGVRNEMPKLILPEYPKK